ncbi:hypothetical protein [Thermogemmatispora sp.]|uniref:hypothetical protein n=1 Tax=Thermogemmatispora sp. TaxID=1968838 RepID=UPI0035E433AD
MDEAVAKEKNSAGGSYIWFHYKTQFAAQGRLHVIQVEVPVPVAASAEERERLLQEALAGLDQFSARLEQRLNQTSTPRKASPAPAGSDDEEGRSPSARPGPTGSREPPAEPRLLSRPASAPAASAESRVSPSASQLRRRMAPALPSTPGVFGNLNSDLTLPQFLQILRDNFNIDSKQAMKLLGVRSLSNINLREALDQLRHLIAQRSSTTGRAESSTSAAGSSALPEQAYPAVFSQREWSQGRSRQELVVEEESAGEGEEQAAREHFASSLSTQDRRYDEEDDDYQEEQDDAVEDADNEDWYEDDEEGSRGQGEEEEEAHSGKTERRQLSLQERVHARTLLNKLREVRGSTPASQGRLTVLWNVIGEQISEDELRQLIGRIWGVTALKQLSIDQVEALISWAKRDDFERDVAAILALD